MQTRCGARDLGDDGDNLLVRGLRRTRDTGRRWAGPLARPASWARETADRLVVQRLEADLERLVLSLTDPENAQRLQSGLAQVAQLAMQMGFAADPHSARLYELVAWLETEHGRMPVLQRVAAHVAATEATLLGAFGALVGDLGAASGPGAMEDAAQRMHAMRDDAASDLLDLLCALASLVTGEEPPRGSAEDRVLFYEQAGLPEAFRPLAAMALGAPGAFESPAKREETSWRRRLPGARRDKPPQQTGTGLARFVPSLDDPHLRFLTLSHLFFLQAYLTRNLVEALPELLQRATWTPHDGE